MNKSLFDEGELQSITDVETEGESRFGLLPKKRQIGDQRFYVDGAPLGPALLEFWQWAYSDLISNATRGVLAEYVVALAMGLGADDVRETWAAYDLEVPMTPDAPSIKIEVKSAAFIQSWHQSKPSRISFRVKKSRAWDPRTNTLSQVPGRQANVYVFALLSNRDQSTIDPMMFEQWEFFVVPTATLNSRKRSQHSISLKSLRTLSGGSVPYAELRRAVENAALADARLGAEPLQSALLGTTEEAVGLSGEGFQEPRTYAGKSTRRAERL